MYIIRIMLNGSKMANSEIFFQVGNIKYTSETMNSTDLYCPECGEQRVMVENGEGDYYAGPTHLCLVCHFRFCLC